MATGDLSLAALGFLTGHSPYLHLTSWLSSCFVYLSLTQVNRLWYGIYGGILDLPIGDYYLLVRKKISILMNFLNHFWIILCSLSINNNPCTLYWGHKPCNAPLLLLWFLAHSFLLFLVFLVLNTYETAVLQMSHQRGLPSRCRRPR